MSSNLVIQLFFKRNYEIFRNLFGILRYWLKEYYATNGTVVFRTTNLTVKTAHFDRTPGLNIFFRVPLHDKIQLYDVYNLPSRIQKTNLNIHITSRRSYLPIKRKRSISKFDVTIGFKYTFLYLVNKM